MAPTYSRRVRAPGFTLAEVLIAVTILLLVFVSSISAITVGFKLLEEARASTLASQILQSEVENLRLRNWAEITAMPASAPFVVEIDPTIKNFPKFECSRKIETVRSGLKQAVLSVAWKTSDGRARTRRYVTYIAEDGAYDYYYRRR